MIAARRRIWRALRRVGLRARYGQIGDRIVTHVERTP